MRTIEPYWPYAVGVLAASLVYLSLRRIAKAKQAAEPKVAGASTDHSVAHEKASPAELSRGRKATGTQPPPLAPPHVLMLTNEENDARLCEVIPLRCVRVKQVSELVALAIRHRPIAVFVDVELLPELGKQLPGIPIIGVVDAAPAETISKVVRTLCAHPTVAHVIVGSLATSPLGRAQLKSVLERLAGGPEHDLLGAASVGRVAMLAQSSRREARLARMQEYFSKQGLSTRTITAIHEVAEELVMNALYNAPTEAGYFKTPVSRMDEVTLPIDRACEVSYGIEDGTAFVRLRDTFGSLRHERLIEVLTRCNASEIALDESRGGAGLGIWRVFSEATTIAITVIPGRLTDILIRMAPKQGRNARQLLAVDLFFLPDSQTVPDPLALDQDSLFDHSITMIQN